ncbi:HET-domain-containing protein [Rhizodiscina lignyota]|uniref:HET-domain-containing protein n=1 Tax=Rhizodiscina lignyota TaxID=1504668 RepID=A0A9P4IK40_9PEZI|nr:HET-domain-containing protein [Rhizodiscina lignyota]
MTGQYQFTSLEPRRFRLLSVLPGTVPTPLVCSLSDNSLDDPPAYEALSYAWGSAEFSEPNLTLNGYQICIMTELEKALIRLRHPDAVRTLWIDAICINQANTQERNAQVTIMTDVYRAAERVIAWLGEETADSKKAFTFLKEMAMHKKSALRHTWMDGTRMGSDTSSECGDGKVEDESQSESSVDEMPDKESEDKISSQKRSDEPNREDIINEMMSNRRQQGHHLVTGIPELYYDGDMVYDSFFENNQQANWKALDNLLARPWWSRTWIVQEVWHSSNCLLQCGRSTLKWKTFEKAMDYQEGWDDMGNMIKQTKRWKHWPLLKRRYGLAIHLSQKRLLGAKLSDLLWNMWDREATDPRDKVFAVLGLVGHGSREVLPLPDYSKSVQQVFQEVGVHIIQQDKNLDILLAANGLERRNGLPSWVPDWRRDANDVRPALFINGARMRMLCYFSGSADMVLLHGHGYSASGDSEVWTQFSEDLATLHVRSFLLGTVVSVGPVCGGNRKAATIIKAARSTIASSNTLASPQRALAVSKQKLGLILRAGSYVNNGRDPMPGQKEDQVIENIMDKRRFFITSAGHLCIGAARTQPGDNVRIIAGCNFPMVLRPEGDSYSLVGEAYGETYL